ncbi:hypothetical protein CEXT_424931 [Caerostris extrusa]|uniref:Uncharacterized protein n=1 Tax=Caerostris extrusa TaxID=172846 RepID=A0AAV4SRF7_CAEEX|nr:hypothetical protein CEXT_424931 [Caerostris extrusa]
MKNQIVGDKFNKLPTSTLSIGCKIFKNLWGKKIKEKISQKDDTQSLKIAENFDKLLLCCTNYGGYHFYGISHPFLYRKVHGRATFPGYPWNSLTHPLQKGSKSLTNLHPDFLPLLTIANKGVVF